MIFIYCKNEKGKRQFKPFVRYFNNNNIRFKYINEIKEIKEILSEVDINKLKKNHNLIVGQVDDFLTAYISLIRYRRYINIIYRARGIIPEESFLRNNSRLRYNILSFIEKFTLSKSSHILTVTNKQREHFMNKYHMSDKKFIVIHNYVSKEEYKLIETADIHDYREVVYLGSLSKWQSFDKIITIFKNISYKDSEVKFLVCVDKNDVKKAESMLIDNGIKSFEVVNLGYKELIERVSLSTAGIILRDNNLVNKVSCPFKIIDYIQANIPIILSNNIGDYDIMFKDKKFVYQIDLKDVNDFKISESIITFLDEIMISKDIKRRIYSFANQNLDIDVEIRDFIEKIGIIPKVDNGICK